MHGQHHVADVLHRDQTPHAAYVIKLAALRIKAAAGVGIVGREGALHLLHRQTDRSDPRRIEEHLILHGAPAKPRIIRHTGTDLYCGSIVQSSNVLSSIGERSGLCSTYR